MRPRHSPAVPALAGFWGTSSRKEVMVEVVALGSTDQAKAVVTSARPYTFPRVGSLKGVRREVLIFPAGL